ncbi:MAG: ClbS/DfsB family four-helix bundle protein [Paracoccus sp. (in: a-proteobacteria)]|nr:ClbS/DfsB family four-helix bundle protein [Paracoccus sp. (in: a-proteobacteria)]
MAVPASKAELLAAIQTSFARLMADLARVPADRAREASMPGHAGGTLISPADLLAYLIGWNELVLKWLDRDDRGEPVDFPETGFAWNQLGLLAGKFYADHQRLDWRSLLMRLSNANARLLAQIAARPDAELYGRAWYGKYSKGRMIQLNSSSPYANARGRIRKWLRGARAGAGE